MRVTLASFRVVGNSQLIWGYSLGGYFLFTVLCVSFPFILDIKFVGRTSRGHTGGRSHRISHPPSFCGACLTFSREKDSAIHFPRRPWSRILCTNDLIVLRPLSIYFYFCHFSVRKIPFAGIELTSQRVRGYMVPLSYRGYICPCHGR